MDTILEEIGKSTKPVIRIIRKAKHFKVFAIGLNKGVTLKDHKAPGRTKLLILHGAVNYVTAEKSLTLRQFDEYEIPLEEVHQVTGLEEAVCLLVVG